MKLKGQRRPKQTRRLIYRPREAVGQQVMSDYFIDGHKNLEFINVSVTIKLINVLKVM